MGFCFMTPYVGGYLCASAEHTAFILLEYGGSMFITNIGNHIHGLSLGDQRMNLIFTTVEASNHT